MPPSALRNMSPLAAAATECRFRGGSWTTRREINGSKDQKCRVRLHGNLVAIYRLRAVGGPKRPALLDKENPPQKFDQVFQLDNPDPFFQSYLVCREAIHQMLMHTPVIGEFDLSADNWHDFTPHGLATGIVDSFRRDTDEHGGVTLRFNIDVSLTISVDILYDEPKALLLACKEAAAVTQCQFMAMPAECCICMEDLAAAKDTVRLPCSHSFHRGCIVPWFYKVATCPWFYIAATNNPKGKFPGLDSDVLNE